MSSFLLSLIVFWAVFARAHKQPIYLLEKYYGFIAGRILFQMNRKSQLEYS